MLKSDGACKSINAKGMMSIRRLFLTKIFNGTNDKYKQYITKIW